MMSRRNKNMDKKARGIVLTDGETIYSDRELKRRAAKKQKKIKKREGQIKGSEGTKRNHGEK